MLTNIAAHEGKDSESREVTLLVLTGRFTSNHIPSNSRGLDYGFIIRTVSLALDTKSCDLYSRSETETRPRPLNGGLDTKTGLEYYNTSYKLLNQNQNTVKHIKNVAQYCNYE